MEDKEVGELWKWAKWSRADSTARGFVLQLIRKLVEERASKYWQDERREREFVQMSVCRAKAVHDFGIDPKDFPT